MDSLDQELLSNSLLTTHIKFASMDRTQIINRGNTYFWPQYPAQNCTQVTGIIRKKGTRTQGYLLVGDKCI